MDDPAGSSKQLLSVKTVDGTVFTMAHYLGPFKAGPHASQVKLAFQRTTMLAIQC